jgi:hypothetical protein
MMVVGKVRAEQGSRPGLRPFWAQRPVRARGAVPPTRTHAQPLASVAFRNAVSHSSVLPYAKSR